MLIVLPAKNVHSLSINLVFEHDFAWQLPSYPSAPHRCHASLPIDLPRFHLCSENIKYSKLEENLKVSWLLEAKKKQLRRLHHYNQNFNFILTGTQDYSTTMKTLSTIQTTCSWILSLNSDNLIKISVGKSLWSMLLPRHFTMLPQNCAFPEL